MFVPPRSGACPGRPRLLLIEADAIFRRALQLLLQAEGFDVRAFAAAAPALAGSGMPVAAVLVVGFRLPDMAGMEVLRRLQGRGWQGRAVLLAPVPAEGLAQEAKAAGFAAVLSEPVRTHAVLAAVRPVTP